MPNILLLEQLLEELLEELLLQNLQNLEALKKLKVAPWKSLLSMALAPMATLLLNTAAGNWVNIGTSRIGTTGVRLMGSYAEPLQTVHGSIQDFTAKTMS